MRRHALGVGERVLLIQHVGARIVPMAIGRVLKLRCSSVWIALDPPIVNVHTKSLQREGRYGRSVLMSVLEARAYFICASCAGVGCLACRRTGGRYVAYPIARRFLGKD